MDWKSTLKLEFQSSVLDDVCYGVYIRPLYCDVTSFDSISHQMTVMDENWERCTFPILSVNVPLFSQWLCDNIHVWFFFYHWITESLLVIPSVGINLTQVNRLGQVQTEFFPRKLIEDVVLVEAIVMVNKLTEFRSLHFWRFAFK